MLVYKYVRMCRIVRTTRREVPACHHLRIFISATFNMASFFGLGGPAAKVEIALDNSDGRKSIEVASEEAQQELMIYSGGDKVSGTVKVIIPSGKKLEHLGIKVEVIGTIGKLL